MSSLIKTIKENTNKLCGVGSFSKENQQSMDERIWLKFGYICIWKLAGGNITFVLIKSTNYFSAHYQKTHILTLYKFSPKEWEYYRKHNIYRYILYELHEKKHKISLNY